MWRKQAREGRPRLASPFSRAASVADLDAASDPFTSVVAADGGAAAALLSGVGFGGGCFDGSNAEQSSVCAARCFSWACRAWGVGTTTSVDRTYIVLRLTALQSTVFILFT